MITREMIRNGFEFGTVSIEEEYWKSYTLDMTIDMIFNILKDVESAEEHGLDETELDYYISVLAY